MSETHIADYDALANDDEFRRLVRQACNDPGSFVRRLPDNKGWNHPESMTSWQDRAVRRAILTRVIPPEASDS
jgi:hypothetical protein